MIQELVQHIENNSDLVIGTDLFAGPWPDNAADNSAQLRESGGKGKVWNGNRFSTLVDCVTRGSDYLSARSLALTVLALLEVKGAISLPVVNSGESFEVESVSPVNRPQYTTRDGVGRYMFVTTYEVHAKST